MLKNFLRCNRFFIKNLLQQKIFDWSERRLACIHRLKNGVKTLQFFRKPKESGGFERFANA